MLKSSLTLLDWIIVAVSLGNCDATFRRIFQIQTANDDWIAIYTVLAIREISFVAPNALDNYYHLTNIGSKRIDANFPRVILNVE